MTHTPRTYIVIGATGGIGSAVSTALAHGGDNVVVCGRTAETLDRLAKSIGGTPITTDATDYARVHEAVTTASASAGRIDGIVCCVGSILLKPAHLTSDDEWDHTINANLRTAFNTVKAGARAMMKEGGSIVLCSSAVAQTGIANHEAIAAAKSGVIGLARSAAATYASRGIRVNCVAPGLTETPMTRHLFENEAATSASTQMHALGRLGRPADIASAIVWLLDPDNSWVTGQVIGVDGGLGQIRPR